MLIARPLLHTIDSLFRGRLNRITAVGLFLLVVSRFTAPFATCDFSRGLQGSEVLPKLSVVDIDTFVVESRHAARPSLITICGSTPKAVSVSV